MSREETGPVFIVASERSGTNLIRRRISEYQGVYYGPSPIHILKHFFYHMSFYKNLNDDDNFEQLVIDCQGLAYHHFSPWDEVIESREIFDRYSQFVPSRRRSIVGVMHVMYSICAERKGYKSYVCKDNNLFDYLYPIALTIPAAKFIFLYRDPRDSILSQLKRPLQIKNIPYLATTWKQEQIKVIQGFSFEEIKERVYTISYEEFIENEKHKLDEIFQFLNVERTSFKNNLFVNEKTEIKEWSNLDKDTIKNNSGKYLDELSSASISMIESITKTEMRALSYRRVGNGRSYNSIYLRLLIFLGNVKHILTQRLFGIEATAGEMRRIAYKEALYDKWK